MEANPLPAMEQFFDSQDLDIVAVQLARFSGPRMVHGKSCDVPRSELMHFAPLPLVIGRLYSAKKWNGLLNKLNLKFCGTTILIISPRSAKVLQVAP